MTCVLTATLAISIVTGVAVDAGMDVTETLDVFRMESSYNPCAVGDAGMAVGGFQIWRTTWEWLRGWMGRDPNPDLRWNLKESAETYAFAVRKGWGCLWTAYRQLKGVSCRAT